MTPITAFGLGRMMLGFQPPFMPCSECGASVALGDLDEHACDPERWLDYQVFQLRTELEELEDEVGAYLASSRGKFDLWCAEQARRAGGDGAAAAG